MPKLKIVIVDPPRECPGMTGLHMAMCTKKGDVPPNREADGSLSFVVEFMMKADRSGTPQPVGPAVTYHGDGRRFVYFGWYGDAGGGMRMFRRLKVFFDRAPDFDGTRDGQIFVSGRDRKGGPACATAVVLPGDNR